MSIEQTTRPIIEGSPVHDLDAKIDAVERARKVFRDEQEGRKEMPPRSISVGVISASSGVEIVPVTVEDGRTIKTPLESMPQDSLLTQIGRAITPTSVLLRTGEKTIRGSRSHSTTFKEKRNTTPTAKHPRAHRSTAA